MYFISKLAFIYKHFILLSFIKLKLSVQIDGHNEAV